jgi:hypothetical protein
MIGAAQVQPYYGMDKKYRDYESDNEMNSYDKKPYGQESYGKDYDKFKDNSVSIKKIKCNNINANLNNVNASFGSDPVEDGDTNGANGGADGGASEALAAQGSEAISANGLMNGASDGDRSFVDRENNFAFVCINNNNNTIVEGEEPEPPEPETCEECFTAANPNLLEAKEDVLTTEGEFILPISETVNVIIFANTIIQLCESFEG